MIINGQQWSFLKVIRNFYPVNLIFAHLKYNFASVLVWAILFLIIFNKAGSAFGLSHLFLSPEYLGEVSALSFFLTGFALGGFTMGFNTYSYVRLGARFPFLTTINKPFLKFCVNNAIIPVLFIVCYITQVVAFQRNEELADLSTVLIYCAAFLGGISLFLVFSFLFFFPLAGKDDPGSDQEDKPIQSTMHKNVHWYDILRRQKERQHIYFGKRMKLFVSRSASHFDKELIEKIYAKNRVNASLFEFLTIATYLILGFFNDFTYFEFPAAVSIILLFTIGIMLFSALKSWLNRWVYPLILTVIIFMDFLSSRTELFNYTSYAFGLNYNKEDAYTIPRIREIAGNTMHYTNSLRREEKVLAKWKQKTGKTKPKLIIINTSGGGLRSALWTMLVLQKCNTLIGQDIQNQIHLITGASGGMIGASYHRSVLLQYQLGEIDNIDNFKYRENMSKDLLNRLAFMASTNDMFIRYQNYVYNDKSYTKERGYAFEEQLHKNTHGILDHPLGYYRQFEEKAIIPTMVFSPTIINDGRRLMIAARPMDILSYYPNERKFSIENIDIHRILEQQRIDKLRFSSVLRSSATFPFVMPMMTLPTKPEIQLMDAGLRDNYGGTTTARYLTEMNDWIKENTSGVIIIQIRDIKKTLDDETYGQISFLGKLTLPFGNMYKNFPKVHDYGQEQLLEMGTHVWEFPLDLVSFNLIERKVDKISLSWHLTSVEKKKIMAAFYSSDNQKALEKLKELVR